MLLLLYASAGFAVAKTAFWEILPVLLWQLWDCVVDGYYRDIGNPLFQWHNFIDDATLKNSQPLILKFGLVTGLASWAIERRYGLKAAEIAFSLTMLLVVMRKGFQCNLLLYISHSEFTSLHGGDQEYRFRNLPINKHRPNSNNWILGRGGFHKSHPLSAGLFNNDAIHLW